MLYEVITNNAIVDSIGKKINGTATIFQRIPDGYLRISTNVMDKNGNRAVGTYIPYDSPVAHAISLGDNFFGRAFVVDDWYLSAYCPIKINGKIEGMLYCGVKEKNLDGIKRIFKAKKYYKEGYPYLVASYNFV